MLGNAADVSDSVGAHASGQLGWSFAGGAMVGGAQTSPQLGMGSSSAGGAVAGSAVLGGVMASGGTLVTPALSPSFSSRFAALHAEMAGLILEEVRHGGGSNSA